MAARRSLRPYLTKERIAKANQLKLAITAGIGSDHVDLQAAMDRGITVAEVTYCNSISVSEHEVMMILALVRNYIPSYQWVIDGGWNIADCVARSYDVEGMQIGTVGTGRIGSAVLRRLRPFDVTLHYTDRHRLPEAVEKDLGVTFHPDAASMVGICDVVTINAPLHPETDNLFDEAMIARMKRGAYLVNGARQDLQSRLRRPCAGERAARRLCRRCVLPAAGPQRPSLAIDAASRHDTAYFRIIALGPGPLRRRHPRNPGVLVRRPADPGRNT